MLCKCIKIQITLDTSEIGHVAMFREMLTCCTFSPNSLKCVIGELMMSNIDFAYVFSMESV